MCLERKVLFCFVLLAFVLLTAPTAVPIRAAAAPDGTYTAEKQVGTGSVIRYTPQDAQEIETEHRIAGTGTATAELLLRVPAPLLEPADVWPTINFFLPERFAGSLIKSILNTEEDNTVAFRTPYYGIAFLTIKTLNDNLSPLNPPGLVDCLNRECSGDSATACSVLSILLNETTAS